MAQGLTADDLRALAIECKMQEALISDHHDALRDRLDDNAAAVIDGEGPLADRVATARAAMHAELEQEAAAVGARLRLELLVVTVVAAGFGMVVLGAAARQA